MTRESTNGGGSRGLDHHRGGSGEPLVLIRGLSSDLQAWALQVPALAKHFRVITYDNRGAGRSDKPTGPYTMQLLADDAIRQEWLGV